MEDVRSPLLSRPFWASLRDSVAPAGKLRSLKVGGHAAGALSASDVEPLSQLSGSLEELVITCPRSPDDVNATPPGLPRFPESVLALTELTHLELTAHVRIASIPAGISNLKKLKKLSVKLCSLSSLPKELGELSGLEVLNVTVNKDLGAAPQDESHSLPSSRG